MTDATGVDAPWTMGDVLGDTPVAQDESLPVGELVADKAKLQVASDVLRQLLCLGFPSTSTASTSTPATTKKALSAEDAGSSSASSASRKRPIAEAFASKCTSVLGESKWREMQEAFAWENNAAVAPEIIAKVVEKYDAKHLFPVRKWAEGGRGGAGVEPSVNCWTVFNLLRYCKNEAAAGIRIEGEAKKEDEPEIKN
eukprot:g3724.t1